MLLSVAVTVPTAVSMAASAITRNVYEDAPKVGGTQVPLDAISASEGSLHVAVYVVPLPYALTWNWCSRPQSSPSTVWVVVVMLSSSTVHEPTVPSRYSTRYLLVFATAVQLNGTLVSPAVPAVGAPGAGGWQ